MGTITKGFIKDWNGNKMLPITRGELVLDVEGNVALTSNLFLAGTFKDAQGKGLPGLITAAERAMLNGASGQNIVDLYSKIEHINAGLSFGGTQTGFYKTANDGTTVATPINVNAVTDQLVIKITEDGNAKNVSLGLAPVTVTKTATNLRIKSIDVDSFGRVTSVTGAAIENSELPATISDKKFSGCTTEIVGASDTAIVNKKYVDDAVSGVTVVATGALKFGGTFNNANDATSAINNGENINAYYKITTAFDLATTYFHDTASAIVSDNKIKLKAGDTLIIHKVGDSTKFVYVPSGDEITTISVTSGKYQTAPYSKNLGDVVLNFSDLFTVAATSNVATISLQQVTDKQNGYLSASDYAKFLSYEQNLAVSYTPTVVEGSKGTYQIGTLTIGGTATKIYGKNNVSALTLIDGSTSGDNKALNPKLKFTETGASAVEIAIVGTNGIKAEKSGNNINLSATNTTADTTSAKYLTITDGYKFGIKIGKISEDKTSVIDGLTDYAEFQTLVQKVANTFETISNSLNNPSADQYGYGNAKMKEAVAIDI